jgi:hypothetical protein
MPSAALEFLTRQRIDVDAIAPQVVWKIHERVYSRSETDREGLLWSDLPQLRGILGGSSNEDEDGR